MRAWKILEEKHDEEDSRYGKRYGRKDSIMSKLEEFVEDVYECGIEEGYHKAKEEMSSYGERDSYRRSMR